MEKMRKDPSIHFRVNIGLPHLKPSRRDEYRQRTATLHELRSDSSKVRSVEEISLDDVRCEWLRTSGPFHMKTLAEHFNIYDDLFGEAYFVPRVPLTIKYEDADGVQTAVYSGNQIKPVEAASAPMVSFDADPSSMWSLVLTNPDGHFSEPDAEYVHWFIGNIPAGDVSKGETVVDYLQPFPARGLGSQRMIFILYKQEGLVDFTAYKKKSPCHVLAERTFRTKEFYRQFEDQLTPAGLAFYQTDWDASLTDFFHKTLDMKEPIYEFDFPVPYKKPAVWFPKKQPFNLYMDKHRDPKQIAKELLVQRFKSTDPFQPPAKPLRFPNAMPEDNSLPSWYRVELRKRRLRWGRYSDM